MSDRSMKLEIEANLRAVRRHYGARAKNMELQELCDKIYDDYLDGSTHDMKPGAACAVGWLVGAAEAADTTLFMLCDTFGITQ